MTNKCVPTLPVLPSVGWRETIIFPSLNNAKLIAKVDTGARSSALHVQDLAVVEQGGQWCVSFQLPKELFAHQVLSTHEAHQFTLPLKAQRTIKNSGGQQQQRCVVDLPIVLGEYHYTIEVTLTCRQAMKYPMLLGRTAIRGRFLVDVATSFQLSH
jgi:hypothetical protein